MELYNSLKKRSDKNSAEKGPKIVIIGAGPAGLGAAHRLQEIGYMNWEIYERNPHHGGLASSHRNGKGFIWDIGAHAIYSHYEYIDKLLDKLLGDDFILNKRNTWVWVLNHWVPYPFQNNIRYLPKDKVEECLVELFRARERENGPKNFKEWILYTFGSGIAKYFMLPYNQKLWAYPLDQMEMDWLSKRVSLVDMERLIKNVIYERDDSSWGPNVEFKIPSKGGTGALFDKLIMSIKDHLILDEEMTGLDVDQKIVRFQSGKESRYDILINTIPLDQLIWRISSAPIDIVNATRLLKHNSIINVGVGIKKTCPSDKTWIYFPENDCCFHRVTYLSNYSPGSVPDAGKYYSMICETSYSEHKSINERTIIEDCVNGLIKTKLIKEADRELIGTTYLNNTEYAYPIPTIETSRALEIIQPYLEEKDIFSRGRFGAWSYKTGNIDHSIMQGVDTVDKVLGVS